MPSFNDMVIKAAAIALGEFPRANGAYRDGRWELYSRINVGIAVAAAEALVVPTIFDADKKGLRAIATEARALAERVREKTITPPELSGATFTVSNLGMYGVSNFHPVINSPQAAILAVGAIAEAPVVRDGELASRGGWGSRLPAITASSTAPTGPSSWPGCGRCSPSRWGWRFRFAGRPGDGAAPDRRSDRVTAVRRRAVGRRRGRPRCGLGRADRGNGEFTSRPGGSRAARALGCAHTERTGEPGEIGSTIPGFVVARAVRPAVLALMGEHRFSRYALVLTVTESSARVVRLGAETRAEFPGAAGTAYRALVIGTRGHVLVTRSFLRSVRRRAERA